MKTKQLYFHATIFWIFSLMLGNLCLAYDWPIGSGWEQQKITSTFMEYRSTNNLHFHSGVDMVEWNNNVEVYNIQDNAYVYEISGSGYYEYIRAGNFKYLHVDVWDLIQPGDYLPINVWIGDIYQGSDPHLHFNEGEPGQWVNPLEYPGLEPYSDSRDPVLVGISLYTDGANPQPIPTTNVQGNVDIVVDCYDRTYNYNPPQSTLQPGVFSIEYWIEDENNNVCDIYGQEEFISNFYNFVLLTNNSNPGFTLIWHSDNHLYGTNKLDLVTGTPSNGFFDSDLIRNGNFQICIEIKDIAGFSQNSTSQCYGITINNPAQVRTSNIQNTTQSWYGENLVTGHFDPNYNRDVLRVINSTLYFEQCSRVTIASDVWLIIDINSLLWIDSNVDLVLQPGAEIIYENGATGAIASDIEFQGNGSCFYNKGQLTLSANVNLNVENGGLVVIDGGEFILENNAGVVFESNSQKLDIKPGSTIRLGDGAEIVVKSYIDAQGTEQDSIRFTSLSQEQGPSGYWKWLKIDGSGLGSGEANMGIIKYAAIENADYGVYGY